MNYESITTGCIDVEALPWVPFLPYSPDVLLKYIKLDPVRGEMIVMLKSPGDMQMPRHHHSGTVIVYTITGKWKYVEHDRSEEQKSELQSLMRISYAVFCL